MALPLVFAAVVSGEVMSTTSHWTSDGSRIVTEADVRTADGEITVSQLGGTVDGLTMRVFDDTPLLHPGMLVDVTVHDAVDLEQRMHTVVDAVEISYDPLTSAPGFVRTGPTKAGHYLFWESGCIFLQPDSAGTTAITGDDEFPVIDASIATWSSGTHNSSCSYIRIEEQSRGSVEVGKDNKNVLKFRDSSWCRPAAGNDPMRCYNHAAAGITTATYVDDGTSDRDGAIVDADIEINGVDFAISLAGATTSTIGCHAELQNTLTHELGHLHGLEHTCLAPGDPPRMDDTGAQVPLCSATTSSKILDAVMYPFQNCGETKKEALSSDDSNAICSIYPVAKDPGTCSAPSSGGGCSTGGDGRGSLLIVAALGLILRIRSRARLS